MAGLLLLQLPAFTTINFVLMAQIWRSHNAPSDWLKHSLQPLFPGTFLTSLFILALALPVLH